jgi:hypothetical protein
MGVSKLHHYVPQFYLRRFTNKDGKLWAWDKKTDKAFLTTPKSVGAESAFYELYEFPKLDPLTMEKQFADLEAEVSKITEQWLCWLDGVPQGNQLKFARIKIPKTNREIVSLYMALQILRTADARDTISTMEALVPKNEISDGDRKFLQSVYLLDLAKPRRKQFRESTQFSSALALADRRFTERDRAQIHRKWLWDEELVNVVAKRIEESTWIFGRNLSSHPFFTSDNPVAFKTGDNRMWVKIGFLTAGTYAVFPLSPQIVMYCHDRRDNRWSKIAKFNNSLSPVNFSASMVELENAGQVFNAGRFVISPVNEFKFARELAKTIETDRYAPQS